MWGISIAQLLFCGSSYRYRSCRIFEIITIFHKREKSRKRFLPERQFNHRHRIDKYQWWANQIMISFKSWLNHVRLCHLREKKHFIWKCADLIYNYLIWFADKLIPSSSLIWASFSWLPSINISCSPGSQQQTHPQTGLLLLLLCAHAGTDRCADAWQMPRPFPAYLLEHSNSGKKVSIRFDSILATESIVSIRFDSIRQFDTFAACCHGVVGARGYISRRNCFCCLLGFPSTRVACVAAEVTRCLGWNFSCAHVACTSF